MFLSDWRLLLRRWYVVVFGLLATVLLCFLASRFVPTRYEATSGILLLPPTSTVKGVPDNPFLSLGGLDTVSGVVARAATDRALQAEVEKAGGTGSYKVEPDVASGGPVLLITVDDVTPEGTLATLKIVSQRVPELLTSLQTTSGVRQSALIRSRELPMDSTAQPIRKPLIRALIVAVAGGLAGTVLLASLVDGYLARRAARARPADEPEEGPVGAEEPPSPPDDFWTGGPLPYDPPRGLPPGRDAPREPAYDLPPGRDVPREPAYDLPPGRDAPREPAYDEVRVETPPRGTRPGRAGRANGFHANGGRTNGAYRGGAPAGPGSGPGRDEPARFWVEEPVLHRPPAGDPDLTMEIAYEGPTDPEPTVEIAYGRLEAELRRMRSERRSEPG